MQEEPSQKSQIQSQELQQRTPNAETIEVQLEMIFPYEQVKGAIGDFYLFKKESIHG